MTWRIWLLAIFAWLHSAASAAELQVLASNASQSGVREVARVFEKMSGRVLKVQNANNPILKKQIQDGVPFDVVVIETAMLDELIKDGKVAAGTRVDLARVGMALLSRTDGPKPDISTLDAFRSALRAAESIGYIADGHSGTVFLATIAKLGVADQLKSRLRPLVGRPCSVATAKGEVQLCAAPSSTVPPGLQRVGYFPDEVQVYVELSGGLSATALEPELAREFHKFPASPDAAAIFKGRGFIAPRIP